MYSDATLNTIFVSCIVFAFAIVLLMYLFHRFSISPRSILRMVGVKCHVWEYRNPADRTCKHCGMVQNQFHNHGILTNYDEWRVMVYEPTGETCKF